MKSRNQILLEKKIRKMVREELSIDDIKKELDSSISDFTERVKNMQSDWVKYRDTPHLNRRILNIEVYLEKIKDSLSKIAF